MNDVCNRNTSFEGTYDRDQQPAEDFTGVFELWSGNNQFMELVKTGTNRYKAVFTGNCRAETLEGSVNSRGVLEIPLRGGFNDKIEVSRQGSQLKVYVTNRNVIRKACGNYNIDGLYNRSRNSSYPPATVDFSGVYSTGRQYVQFTKTGYNRYTAHFFGACILTTEAGTVTTSGVLEIPIKDGYRTQTMKIRKITNGIEIRNTSNNAVIKLCNGATLEGVYLR
jgi:hypothetical protein